MTPERKAEVEALLDSILGPDPKPPPPKPPKPKVVVRDNEVIRDADVIVSPADRNAQRRGGTHIAVRRPEPELPPLRPGELRIDIAAAQRQWEMEEQFRRADRAQRRQLDPFNFGHWGPLDD